MMMIELLGVARCSTIGVSQPEDSSSGDEEFSSPFSAPSSSSSFPL